MGTNAKQVSKHEHLSWTIEERFANVTKAGIPAAGVELKIVDDEVRPLGMWSGGSAEGGVLCFEIGGGAATGTLICVSMSCSRSLLIPLS